MEDRPWEARLQLDKRGDIKKYDQSGVINMRWDDFWKMMVIRDNKKGKLEMKLNKKNMNVILDKENETGL